MNVLEVIGLASALAAGLVCPGLGKVLAREMKPKYPERSIRQAVYRLDKKGWIILKQKNDGWHFKLSQKGWKEFTLYQLGKKGIPIPKKWDKKWRIIVFDIPEKRYFIRQKVRAVLRSLGFHRLQDSVWVHPFECKDILELLRTHYGVRAEALYIRVEYIDGDRWLRKLFSLDEHS